MPLLTQPITGFDTALASHSVSAISVNDDNTMSNTVRTLSQMYPGQSGHVLEVTAEPALALNMLEIGLVRGAVVRYLRSAPWGDPIEIEVDGFLLSLRRSEADAIIVSVESDGPDPHQGA
ncbi:MAG: hypothetical protein Kow0074_19110 [Candidatus Zixiibacteriota bacterium]